MSQIGSPEGEPLLDMVCNAYSREKKSRAMFDRETQIYSESTDRHCFCRERVRSPQDVTHYRTLTRHNVEKEFQKNF